MGHVRALPPERPGRPPCGAVGFGPRLSARSGPRDGRAEQDSPGRGAARRPPADGRASCWSWPRTAKRPQKENRKPAGVRTRRPGGHAAPPSASRSPTANRPPSSGSSSEKPSLRFDDVAGLDDVKEDIRLKMIYPFQHPELAEKFGIRPGGGVLLYGPPGTGKTMLAKATAGEIDATFFRISPADVLSKWVGEAEQNIKKLFDAAAAEPRSIIFIDEIEALVPARRDEGSSVMQRVVPQILQGMEGFDKKAGRPILLMGATNVPWQLDPADAPAGPIRREGLHPAARPARPAEDARHLPGQAPGRRRRRSGRPGRRDSTATAAPTSNTSATVPRRSRFCRASRPARKGRSPRDHDRRVERNTPPSVTPEVLNRFEAWTRAGGDQLTAANPAAREVEILQILAVDSVRVHFDRRLSVRPLPATRGRLAGDRLRRKNRRAQRAVCCSGERWAAQPPSMAWGLGGGRRPARPSWREKPSQMWLACCSAGPAPAARGQRDALLVRGGGPCDPLTAWPGRPAPLRPGLRRLLDRTRDGGGGGAGRPQRLLAARRDRAADAPTLARRMG